MSHEHTWTPSVITADASYYECVPCGAEGADTTPHSDYAIFKILQEAVREPQDSGS